MTFEMQMIMKARFTFHFLLRKRFSVLLPQSAIRSSLFNQNTVAVNIFQKAFFVYIDNISLGTTELDVV